MSADRAAPWFVRFGSGEGSRRLFCFPFAGGGATAFARWRHRVPPHVELWAAELPGRGHRLGEHVRSDLRAVVRELRVAITPLLDRPYALFGHSMGALLAYELAVELTTNGVPLPSPLVVSGFPAPHLRSTGAVQQLEAFPDANVPELIEQLRAWGGTPPEVLENPELISLTLPVLRGDLTMCRTYRHRSGQPLACPLLAVGGKQDPETPVPDLVAWSALTAQWLGTRLFPGGHFYLWPAQDDLLATITALLPAPVVSGSPLKF